MGRCPYYLEMNGFERLANTVDVKISKEGIEALAEICEMFGEMLLKNAKSNECFKVGPEELREELGKIGFDVTKSDKENRIFEKIIKK